MIINSIVKTTKLNNFFFSFFLSFFSAELFAYNKIEYENNKS